MSFVLVVDDMALVRELLNAGLKGAGYETQCAADGHQALAATKARVPDLVLLDLSMPGMGGLAVLESLRATPATAKVPVILLTASGEKENIIKAARWGVQDYLLKSQFSLKELLSRVNKYAPLPKPNASVASPAAGAPPAPSPAPAPRTEVKPANPSTQVSKVLSREECTRRAEHALQARTLSGVVAQVVSLATSPRTDLSDLANLVSRDPVLSARVLQAANSAGYMSTRGVVSNIYEAVRNIGCSAVRDIAVAMGVFDAMPASSPDGFNPIRCWQHSFAVATLCQRLVTDADSGLAYLVGLCHDLGEILFRTHFSEEYRQVLQALEATGKRRDELERTILGMTQGELVQVILRCLGLPDAIRLPIEEYYKGGLIPGAAAPLARVLRLAEVYANGALLASSANSPIRPITRAECRSATGQDHPPTPDGPALRSEIFALTAMLARLSAKDEAELMAPLFPRRKSRVFLARDASLSSFDPIAAVLDAMAEVTVSDALPSADALAAHQGLVVLARSTSAGEFAPQTITKLAPSTPVMWLVGRIDDRLPDTPVKPLAWPIPLGQIADFIQRLPQRT